MSVNRHYSLITFSLNLKIVKPGLGSGTMEQTVRFHTVANIHQGLQGTLDEVFNKCPLVDIIHKLH